MCTLPVATKEFISHCKFEKNLSSKTIKAYQTDLNQFQKFLLEKDYSTEVVKITKIEVRDYLVESVYVIGIAHKVLEFRLSNFFHQNPLQETMTYCLIAGGIYLPLRYHLNDLLFFADLALNIFC